MSESGGPPEEPGVPPAGTPGAPPDATRTAPPALGPPAQPTASSGPAGEPAGRPGTLTWEYDIPLVNNLLMVRDFVLVIALSLIIMQLLVLLVGFLAGEGLVVLPLKVYGIVAAVVFALYLIAAGVVFLNRYRTRFTVSPRAVAYEATTRERRRNRVILVLSILLGRPGPAMIATAQEAGQFFWKEIEKVTVHRRQRAITLSNSWRPVLRLYCSEDNFGDVVELVQAYAGAAAAKRAARPTEVSRPRRRSWRFYGVWTIGVVAATFLGMADYDTNLDDMWRWLLLAAALILISGLFEHPLVRRLCALMGFVAVVLVLIYLLQDAFRPIVGLSGGHYGRGYEVDSWFLVMSLVGQVALLSMAGWRLFGKARRPPGADGSRDGSPNGTPGGPSDDASPAR